MILIAVDLILLLARITIVYRGKMPPLDGISSPTIDFDELRKKNPFVSKFGVLVYHVNVRASMCERQYIVYFQFYRMIL